MDVHCFTITAASPAGHVGEKDFLHILVSSDSDSNDIGTFMSQRIPQKTETSVSYGKRVKTLLDVLQEEHGPLETFQETKTLSIENENAAEESVKDLPTEDHSTSGGEKSRQGRHSKLGGNWKQEAMATWNNKGITTRHGCRASWNEDILRNSLECSYGSGKRL